MYSSVILSLLAYYVLPISAIPVPVSSANTELADCPENGVMICSTDGLSFSVCNWNKAVPMGSVAAGTKCIDGKIVAAASNSGYISMLPIPPHSPQPTASSTDSTTTTTLKNTIRSTSIVIVTMTRDPSPAAPADPTTSLVSVTSSAIPIAISTTNSRPAAPSLPTLMPTAQETTSAAPAMPTATASLGAAVAVTPDILLAIAPSSGSCSGAPFPDECETAVTGAPFLTSAFSTYNIHTAGEAAAILSLIAFESGDFKYNINHFPGRAGQGTRAMLTIPFVLSFAQSFTSTDSIQPGLTEGSVDNAPDTVKNAVRALTLVDDKSWASAAWFYQNNCSDVVKSGLQSGTSRDAWVAYVSGCVGTSVTSDREAYWARSIAALKI